MPARPPIDWGINRKRPLTGPSSALWVFHRDLRDDGSRGRSASTRTTSIKFPAFEQQFLHPLYSVSRAVQ